MSFASVVNQTENATDNKRLIGFVWHNASSARCLIDLGKRCRSMPRSASAGNAFHPRDRAGRPSAATATPRPGFSLLRLRSWIYGKGTRNYTEGGSVFKKKVKPSNGHRFAECRRAAALTAALA